MITGKERAFPSTDGDTFANEGLTIKHHMMIEFTKSILSGISTNPETYDVYLKTAKDHSIKLVECVAQMSDDYAEALIKQFNK